MKTTHSIVGKKSILKPILAVSVAALLALPAVGCGYLIAGGAGAAGGYILRDEGYEVQSPVKKEETKKTETKSDSKSE